MLLLRRGLRKGCHFCPAFALGLLPGTSGPSHEEAQATGRGRVRVSGPQPQLGCQPTASVTSRPVAERACGGLQPRTRDQLSRQGPVITAGLVPLLGGVLLHGHNNRHKDLLGVLPLLSL